MSTQIETGQAYVPSPAQPSDRLRPWLFGAVTVALATAAILAVNASDGRGTEIAEGGNSAGLTKAEQAQADRLTGMAVVDSAIISLQSEYGEDTPIIPVEVDLSGPGWVGQDAALDEAPPVVVLSPEAGRFEFVNPEFWTEPRDPGPAEPRSAGDLGGGVRQEPR